MNNCEYCSEPYGDNMFEIMLACARGGYPYYHCGQEHKIANEKFAVLTKLLTEKKDGR